MDTDRVESRSDGVTARRRPTWGQLGRKARAWRAVHATWSIAQLWCLAHIWSSALRGRRDPGVWAGVALLGIEGGALVVGHGNCPVGALQEEWGDPVPFFELVLPPRAAKAAIPALAVATVAGMALLVLRSPGLTMRA